MDIFLLKIKRVKNLIIKEIKEFSEKRQWKYGLKEEYIINNVKRKKI